MENGWRKGWTQMAGIWLYWALLNYDKDEYPQHRTGIFGNLAGRNSKGWGGVAFLESLIGDFFWFFLQRHLSGADWGIYLCPCRDYCIVRILETLNLRWVGLDALMGLSGDYKWEFWLEWFTFWNENCENGSIRFECLNRTVLICPVLYLDLEDHP